MSARGAAVDLVSHSTLFTERLGERLGAAARAGDVIALWGELGAGKTVLARGVARSLGVGEEVRSPTFVIAHEHEGRLPMYHLDFYRLRPEDLVGVGWEEYLDMGGVVVIEWPDRAGDALPAERLDVRLEHLSDTKRGVVLEPRGSRAAELVTGVADALGA